MSSNPCFRNILGVRFFTGPAREAVQIALTGGLVVVPSAPVLLAMEEDPYTAEALLNSDLAITDSGLMVLLWRFLKRARLERVSGLEYLKLLLSEPSLREPGAVFWVMPSIATRDKTLAWLGSQGFPTTTEDCYIAPVYGAGRVSDPELLARINERRPAHIFMAIGGGVQEKLAYYLKEGACYRPGLHCTGAAIGFLTGDQVRIPTWADHFYLGWLMRCLHAPERFVPRYWKARKLVWLLLKYRDRAPEVRK
ncbi:MAG: WecB/TagA/CpsF family glycosyltransferase [Chthoniobacteraceae bacterium]